MARTRREFAPEYKGEAVTLAITTGRAGATVARELGVNAATLGRWVTAFKVRNASGQTEVTEPKGPSRCGCRRCPSGLGVISSPLIIHLHGFSRTPLVQMGDHS
ncbi:hypothetical protein GCM10022381_41830 [Leifsonia kafniensis]|uniref:Transposase n=1 Tax=Leifsonia kafniensis TaxID=475957 RepID=A0ABP7L6S1_9MICO